MQDCGRAWLEPQPRKHGLFYFLFCCLPIRLSFQARPGVDMAESGFECLQGHLESVRIFVSVPGIGVEIAQDAVLAPGPYHSKAKVLGRSSHMSAS